MFVSQRRIFDFLEIVSIKGSEIAACIKAFVGEFTETPKIFLKFRGFLKICIVLLLLNLFFVSIELLGAFKATGTAFGQNLILSLSNYPVFGLLIGILITTVIQSSSATTSLVVALAASGLFGGDMLQALKITIPVLMGANIGTSVTNTVVSLGHIGNRTEFERAFSAAIVHDLFNLLTVAVLFPLQVFTNFLGHVSSLVTSLFVGVGGIRFVSPLKTLIKPQAHVIQDICGHVFFDEVIMLTLVLFLFFILLKKVLVRTLEKKSSVSLFFFIAAGFAVVIALHEHYPALFRNPMISQLIFALGILFFSLYSFVRIVRGAVLAKTETLLHRYIFKTPWRALVFGMMLTAIIQSSSATTSMIVPLAGAGILTIYQIYPYTLGANVGTTITAILASLATANPIPISMAFAHLFFNIFGIAIFYPLRKLPIALAKLLGNFGMRHRFFPVIFILLVFYLIPLLLIYAFK